MNDGIKASNLGVVGDCGRYPMFIETRKRAVKYWLNILSDEKYVKKCYNMLYHFDVLGHSNWVTNIKHTLYTHGLGYIWERQMVTNETGWVFKGIATEDERSVFGGMERRQKQQ